VLSRVANSIYWMNRYLERADNVARFLAVNTHLILDMGWESKSTQWEPLVRASGDDDDFNLRFAEANEKNVVRFLTFDRKNPNSIISCVRQARENARTVREVISSEMWETINALYHLVEKDSRKRRIGDLQDFFMAVRSASHLFTGLIENTMSHSQDWHFARMGMFLERADKTARLLDVKYFLLLPTPDYVDSPFDTVQWGAVLKSVTGFEMYRKKFHRANYHDVAAFLILDSEFPRSIRYCVDTAARSLSRITEIIGMSVPAQEEMVKLQAMLDGTHVEAVLQGGLHEYVDVFQFNLNVVDNALYQSFFAIKQD
jgi:uncharacterized alpha-E superfamily protein